MNKWPGSYIFKEEHPQEIREHNINMLSECLKRAKAEGNEERIKYFEEWIKEI